MDSKEELYYQSIVSQLVKIEKDMRGQSESLLAIMIEMIEMNRLTLKTLQAQFNIFLPNPSTGINPLDAEMDDEIAKLKERIAKHKGTVKELSGMLSLEAPKGNGDVTVNDPNAE